ncbi:complement factor B-like [Pempheris klunzingeri]|uniref:complement factor B-like n=1 Tax=Pempheris klunzingeri TaxID=3127111 RepID=UPI003980DC8A
MNSFSFNMGSSAHWSWLAALSCLLCMGGEVQCNCTEADNTIAGGHYTLTKKLERGSMLVYHCPEGYFPYPDLTRLCLTNDRWRPAPKRFLPQRCKPVECPDPHVLEYGSVSPPQERYFVDNETVYECYSGYTMRGSSRRVCLPNGKWSGSTPICSSDSGDDCADPGVPAGASRLGNMFGIDDKVKYSCNSGLFLVGQSERVCQENGQWSGKEPACYYRHTYDTSLEVSEAFGSSIKDSLTTLEPIDDTQEGRKIRISKNGTLNIYIAVDISESIEESHFNDARNVISTLISKISSFSVTPNYEIVFFSSEIYEVVSILDFLDQKIQRNTILDKINKFTVGDKNAGTDLNEVFRTFQERMAIIKQRVGDEGFKEHRHVLIVFTDGAYNMGGSPAPTIAKIKNMVYMNNGDEEIKAREEYLDIYVFAIGAEILDDDLQPLTAGVGGQHYFRMKDITNLQETFDEIIDEEEVKGLCGLHKESGKGSGKDSKRKNYPWMAFIAVQNEGLKKCIGSLVTPQFILTAAHCFTFGDLPEHVTVEIDDGEGKVKRVKTFRLHPNYNVTAKVGLGVKEFYDYDVALIQLEKDVRISSAVRPICIPCTQETSDALQLVGESTCKSQEEKLLKNNLEKLNFLTRTSNIVDEKDVHAKLGNNRNECIRHALQAQGITTKNEKDAVTDNFLCTGGQSPFRDHIACTGDSGGAVFKNYEHRTIQVAVVSWGTKNLCKAGGKVESDSTSRDFHINLFKVVPFLKSILGNDTQDEYAPLQFLKN